MYTLSNWESIQRRLLTNSSIIHNTHPRYTGIYCLFWLHKKRERPISYRPVLLTSWQFGETTVLGRTTLQHKHLGVLAHYFGNCAAPTLTCACLETHPSRDCLYLYLSPPFRICSSILLLIISYNGNCDCLIRRGFFF